MKPTDVIEKNYLKKFLFMLLLLLLVITSLASIVLYFTIHKPLDTHYGAIVSIVSDLKETLLITTLKISVLSSLLAALGLLLLGVLYTHRIAGPLDRIKAAIQAIGEGNVDTKIRLREKDAIHHFAESINSMTGRYRDRISALSESLGQMKETVAEFRSLPGDRRDTETIINKISKQNNKIRSQLDNIRS